MVEQPKLMYWDGPQTNALIKEFRSRYPFQHCFPTSSGTAAIHVAVAALGLPPGSEVIVPAITDMGSVIGILYQQLVPVFADIDPGTYNLCPADVRRRITDKTRAIMAVHFMGNPCAMDALLGIAQEHRLSIIEDCAQSWGARFQGKLVGLMGDFGCYSFNDYKHLSCGDGGMVATNSDRFGPGQLGRWGDKFYDRVTGNREPAELAPNYRISEPQSAVAAAQMTKHESICSTRIRLGRRLSAALDGTPGLKIPVENPGDTHTYWFYIFRLETDVFAIARDAIVSALTEAGVPCSGAYILMPVHRYPVFQNHNFFAGSWPLRQAGLTSMDYRSVACPCSEAFLADSIRLNLNEAMTDDYVDLVAHAIRTVLKRHLR